MEVENYVGRSRLFRGLKNEPHGQLVERYATRLVEEKLARSSISHCLNAVSGFLGWVTKRRIKLADIDEHMVERYLRHLAARQSIRRGDPEGVEAMAVDTAR
jgi:site-specific recombinase XerD